MFSPTLRPLLLSLAWGFCSLATGRAADAARGDAPEKIRAVLAAQAAAWNAGDLAGFMDGYARLPTLRFASGGEVTCGWDETLARYRARYQDPGAMGTLAFSDLEITVLSDDAAVVFGRWRLSRSGDAPHGLFTLLFRRMESNWRVVADHTSAAP